ncbi:hypothetical protein Btru_010966 [Bulinus truncatus]|nr:hypothetical protein Btru_010966 [Bulinus truncatus]
MPLIEPVTVAGLVVSRENPKLRWGVKHHLLEVCNKVEDLPDEGVRTILYRSFVKELQEEEKKLEQLSIARGQLMFYHNVGTATGSDILVTLPPDQYENENGEPNEQPQLVARYESEPESNLVNNIRDSVARIDAAVERTEEMSTPRPSEAELQEALAKSLTQIKANFKKHGKRHARTESDSHQVDDSLVRSRLNRAARRYAALATNTHIQYAFLRSKRGAGRATPHLLPQRVFVDGQYLSIFDTNAILENLELEAPLPEPVNPFTTAKKPPPPPPPPSPKPNPPDEHKNPVAKMLFPSADVAMSRALSHGMIDLKDDDVDDDLDDENLLMVDTLDAAGEALMNAKMKFKASTKVPRITALPILPVSVKSLKELQAEHRETDHRIVQFVGFFVGILGVIGVIAVLLVLAVKKRPSKDKYTVFDVPKRRTYRERRDREEQLLKQHEALIDKKRKISPYYSDIETEQSSWCEEYNLENRCRMLHTFCADVDVTNNTNNRDSVLEQCWSDGSRYC